MKLLAGCGWSVGWLTGWSLAGREESPLLPFSALKVDKFQRICCFLLFETISHGWLAGWLVFLLTLSREEEKTIKKTYMQKSTVCRSARSATRPEAYFSSAVMQVVRGALVQPLQEEHLVTACA